MARFEASYTATFEARWSRHDRKTKDTFDLYQRAADGCATFSPDGRWIVYLGEDQVYVQPFPPTGARTRLSTTDGAGLVWVDNGRRIVFAADGDHFRAVDVFVRPIGLGAGAPRELFVQPNTHSTCGFLCPRDGLYDVRYRATHRAKTVERPLLLSGRRSLVPLDEGSSRGNL